MWGTLRPAGVVGAPGQGGGLPHPARLGGRWQSRWAGVPAKGLSWVGFLLGPLYRGGCPLEGGVSGLCSRPRWPLCRPLNVPGSLPMQASASALALPGAGTLCPRAVPRAAPYSPPALARQPAPGWALPDLHPCRGLHTSAASLSPEDWSPSAVVSRRLLSLCTHLAVKR